MSDRLRHHRKEQRRLGTTEAAAELGVRQSVFSRWENGTQQPDAVHMRAIATWLDISVEDVLLSWLEDKEARASRPGSTQRQSPQTPPRAP